MAIVVLFTWLFQSVQAAPCSPDQFTAGFTQCSSAHTRSAIFYPETPCEGPAPAPVSNLTCLLACPSGSFLGYDPHTKASACRPCPANTYSNGGGDRFSPIDHPWTKLLTHFTTYCFTSILFTWELNKDCSDWKALEDGSALVSGNTTLLGWVRSQLIYYADVVSEEGALIVEYRKKSRQGLLGPNGLFSVWVNEETRLEDDNVANDHWKKLRIPLSKGTNEIAFIYEKFSLEEKSDLNAHIRLIELRGTRPNSHLCSPCLHGYSPQGSDSCNSCKANEYYAGEMCHSCPERTFSVPGSSGLESCIELPACQVTDYRELFTGCISDMRTKQYEWNFPHICDESTGVTLPSPEIGLACEPCLPGYHRSNISPVSLESICIPCPPGTATNSSLPEALCSLCPAGTYAPKIVNFTHWSPLPLNVTNDCHPAIGQFCTETLGWVVNGNGLFSGNNLVSNVFLVLTYEVNVMELEGNFEFSWSMSSNPQSMSRLIVAVDGSMVAGYSGNEYHAKSKLFPLQKGLRVVQLTYRHAGTSQEWCSIHWLSIRGSDKGGAPACFPCIPNSISPPGSDICSPCPAGTMANEDHTICQSCPANTYADKPGDSQGCRACPVYSLANSNRTMCIGPANITYGNFVYMLENLTGIREGNNGYSNGLCSQQEFALFCKDSFYGPLHNHGNEFYLSILNPSILTLSSFRHFDSLPLGYAFALLNKSLLTITGSHSPVEPCATDTSHFIVNLGSRIESIQPSGLGFNISYSAGSACPHKGTFSSQVQLICDKQEGDGYPEIAQIDGCNYQFQWRSRLACPLCEQWQIREVRSICVKGERYVYLVEGGNCTMLGWGKEARSWVEPCSQVEEVMNSKLALGLFVVLVGLVLAASIIFACFCKVNRRLHQLLQT